MNIGFEGDGIHAEIAEGDFSMLSNTSVTIDPLTLSYSSEGLVRYSLDVVYSSGVNNVVVLENGKNSRVSASGRGYFHVKLIVEDTIGRTDNHVIMIKVD